MGCGCGGARVVGSDVVPMTPEEAEAAEELRRRQLEDDPQTLESMSNAMANASS